MNDHAPALARALSRRRFMTLTAAAGVTGAVAACSSSGGSASEPGSIRIVVAGSAEDSPRWTELISQFNEQFPDISAAPEFLTAPSNSDPWTGFFSTVQTRIAGGERYDVVYIPTEGQLLFASRGILEPLDDYVDADADTVDHFESDVEPNILEQFYAHAPADGQRYFIPLGYNDTAILYSKAVFENAGVDVPASGWTWDDFRATSEALQQAGVRYAMNFGTNLFDFMPWLLTNGTAVLNDDWTGSRLDEPAAQESVEFVRSFIADGLAPEPGGQFNAVAAMSSGDLAMTFAARGTANALRDRDLDPAEYAYVQIPQNVSAGTTIGIGGFGVFADSPSKDAAWDFLTFVMSQQFQDYLAGEILMGGSPIRTSSATSNAMLEGSPDGTLELYEASKTATLVPGVVNQAQVGDPFNRAMAQMLAGTLDIGQGLADLHAEIDAAVATGAS